jgi:hypothetical protein
MGIQKTLAKYRKLRKSRSSNKFLAFKHQFSNYRKVLKFSFFKSGWLTINYAIRAFIKHL